MRALTWMNEVTDVNTRSEMNSTSREITASLASKAAKGDRNAFCELYGRYKDRLYRYALYKLRDPHMAEDAVSETVLAAWKGIEKLKSETAFGTWIYRILSNRCNTMLADEIQQRSNLENIYRETIAANASVTISSGAGHSIAGSGMSDSTGRNEDPALSIELRQALDMLSDENRQIVLLSVVADLNSTEIAEITGLNANTVRSRLARSLAQMREFLS
ncbi:MAG: RNA polymerase sigma factor [Mogibacterium sp.]|nr:RNA polymerase sigma factor [Mogibacterium sp.]